MSKWGWGRSCSKASGSWKPGMLPGEEVGVTSLLWLWPLYYGESRLTLDYQWVILERGGFKLVLTFLLFYS